MTARTVKDLLNKIKWDKSERADDYELYYSDRFEKNLKKINYSGIKGIEGSFIRTEEALIPIHRVREVRRSGKVVFSRKL